MSAAPRALADASLTKSARWHALERPLCPRLLRVVQDGSRGGRAPRVDASLHDAGWRRHAFGRRGSVGAPRPLRPRPGSQLRRKGSGHPASPGARGEGILRGGGDSVRTPSALLASSSGALTCCGSCRNLASCRDERRLDLGAWCHPQRRRRCPAARVRPHLFRHQGLPAGPLALALAR